MWADGKILPDSRNSFSHIYIDIYIKYIKKAVVFHEKQDAGPGRPVACPSTAVLVEQRAPGSLSPCLSSHTACRHSCLPC